MSDETVIRLASFWELLDEVLNAILFVLIGLEFMGIKFDLYTTLASICIIFITIFSRLISILIPVVWLSRFKFFLNHTIQNSFVAAMGVPMVMIILPLFGVVTQLGLLKQDITVRIWMIILYVGINVPYTTIFLLAFFSNLSSSYEEAAAIDGCPPMKIFW